MRDIIKRSFPKSLKYPIPKKVNIRPITREVIEIDNLDSLFCCIRLLNTIKNTALIINIKTCIGTEDIFKNERKRDRENSVVKRDLKIISLLYSFVR
jgi:hypothetical protein